MKTYWHFWFAVHTEQITRTAAYSCALPPVSLAIRRVGREAAHVSHCGLARCFYHRCIRWHFSDFLRLPSRADSLLGCSSFPPTFLLIRIRYVPTTSAMLPGVKTMVLNGSCWRGRAVKARQLLHDRRRTAGQGALSGVVGAVWVLRWSETEIANSACAFWALDVCITIALAILRVKWWTGKTRHFNLVC